MSTYTVLLKGGLPWGFRLQGGNGLKDPIRIAKINPNSKAYNEGVQVGDYLEAVNGYRTEDINLGDTQQIIKNSTDELLLQLRRSEPTSNGVVNGDTHHSSEPHVNSGAGYKPALRSNKMDSYHNQTPSSSTSGWSQYGGSYPKQQMSGSHDQVIRPLEISVDQPNQHYMQPHNTGPGVGSYYTPPENFKQPFVPSKASYERNVPITVLSKPQRNRSASETDHYGVNHGPVPDSGFSSWQSGLSDPAKQDYSAGSYATLPVKRSPKQQPSTVKTARDTNALEQSKQGHFDFNLYSTLPTIKPLKSTQKVESSDISRQNPGFQYSKPSWTNQEQQRQAPSLYQPSRGVHSDSTTSSTLTSSDSHDTIVSSHSIKEARKPINVIHEEVKPIQVVHEENKPSAAKFEEMIKPQRVVREQSKPVSLRTTEMIKPQRAVLEESRPRRVAAEVQEEIIVPQKKEDIQALRRVNNSFGSLPKTKSPSQKKDTSSFNTLPAKSSVKPSEPVVNGNVTSHITVGPLSPTPVSSKPGIWSPGMKPTSFKKSEPEISSIEPPKSETSFNVKPIWTPGGSPAGARKEFKPVKLNTNVKPIEKPKPKVVSPPAFNKPPETYTWNQEESPRTKETTSLGIKSPGSSVQYQLAGSKLESLLPDAIQNAPHMNGSAETGLSNEFKDDLHLPPTQSPYITLLQKSRESERIDDVKNLSQPIMVTEEGRFPRGAQYIGKVETQEGDVKHTDEYYTTTTREGESSSKVVEQKPKIYEGIGPVDQEGLPLAFRKNIDEKNQHEWYRQMYKNLHKTEKKDELMGINDIIDSIFEDAEENTYKPTYKFPEDVPVSKSVEEVNPYRPSYELPLKFTDESGYRSEPEGRSYGKPKNRSKSISDESRRLYNYPPPNVRSKIEVYKNQPRSIMDYEPGFSSIAFQETKSVHNPPVDKPGQFSNYIAGGVKQTQADLNNPEETGDSKESYKRVQLGGEIPIHGLQKPAPPKPKIFKHQTSDVKRAVPLSEKERRRKEEDKMYRRQRLEQLYEEERKRKQLQEEQDLESRRHNDFFIPSMKSPIPNDRFNDMNGTLGGGSGALSVGVTPSPGMATLSVPVERRRGFQIQGKAKALYNFNAQNSREMSFRKGDIIYLLRQIDKNWFEGERYGRQGIFPVNYVEVMTSIEAAQQAAVQAEGQGRVKYNFTAQSPMELSLRKGEFVTLLRTVDENWFEGRSGNKQGIFPASYVDILQEPSTPLITPAPSVICTPMTGRGTPEMLSPVGYDAPTPPPQPSPSAFNQSRLPASQFGFRPQQQQPLSPPQQQPYHQQLQQQQQQQQQQQPQQMLSPSALRSQSNPLSPINQELEQRIFSPKSQLSPTQPKKQVTINTVVRTEPNPPPTKPGYGVKSKVPDDDLAINRYRAIYAYRPQNEDELELQEGDEVYVMEQCDDGWYVGTSGRTGNFGTFPGNYVQLI